ncbi:BamA/TamA family outer membrane protein [Dyadobacter sp. CY261]|uniref:BamA/TamA family outer membrane protein n=1 Tax=Dyadobacter sp. CY261 TaxID=2907203 RepID=UPI001F471840|nr:BamA/TamA family outer membrane protein [Dyadobacter sp. CY261]MCF0070916.1 BamA/TamA family outer membrane protein [Dyadobacter sp. CY261]
MGKKKLYVLILLIAVQAPQVFAQDGWFKRFVQKTISDTTGEGKSSFRVYPTLGYSPETSVEFGFSSLLLFQAKNDTLNRLSEVAAFTFVTLEGQYGIWLDNAIYGDKDKWFFLGRTRFQRFPLLYYGIGHTTPDKEPALVDANYLLFKQRVLRRVRPNFFIGPEIDYQQLYNAEFKQPEDHLYDEPLGSDGTRNIGLGAALVYDNRHNVLNVRKGFFGELSFLKYNQSIGSHHNFQGFNLDIRSSHPLTKRNVLAWQVYGNFFTGNIPFNQMALMGGEMIMRGYYYGRYRDKNMLATQVEHRWLPFGFSKRLGGAVFAGAAVVGPKIGSLTPARARLSGGVGLRYLLFPKKDIFLRLDVGFTKEGPGFYLFTGEAF